MVIRVLAFASAADALGASELELELSEDATLATLGVRLTADRPALAPLWNRLAFAIDGEIRRGDSPLTPGCEVALLPPVSGG